MFNPFEASESMNIILLGAGGQLGTSLQKVCENQNSLKLTPLTRNQFDICDSFETNLKKLKELNPDRIINCAAYTQVDKAESEEEKANEINGHSLKNLSEICNELKSQLIHISTDFVFNGEKCTPYLETDECSPLSVYGQSKLLGESLIQSHSDSYAIFRTSWVYSNSHPSFYTTMLRLAQDREALNIVSDQVGSPTSADSLAKALTHYILNSDSSAKKLYHFSNQGVCSWFDFAFMIFKLNKIKINLSPIPTSEYPTPAQRPHYSVMSKDLFCKQLNYKIDHWVDALEKVIV